MPPKDEPGAQERFDRGVANALKMPPKPHKPPPEGGRKRQPKKAASVSDTPEYQALRDAVLAAQAAP